MSLNLSLDPNETFAPRIAAAVFAHASAGFRGVVKALPGAHSGSGKGHLVASANGAIAAQNGFTPAAGDVVMVPAGCTNLSAAKDAGPYFVTDPGASGRPYVLDRPSFWAQGSVIPATAAVMCSYEDTLFGGSVWKTENAAGKVVGTDDPAMYPDKVIIKGVALTSGTHAAFTTVPISARGTVSVVYASTYAHTPDTATVNYGAGPITAGAIGAASFVPNAYAAAMAVNTSDSTSIVDIIILN